MRFTIIYIGILMALLLMACHRERVQSLSPTVITSLPDTAMPYTFTQTQAMVRVLSIPGIPFFSRLAEPNVTWLRLSPPGRMQQILGGIDTTGIILDEFFDKQHLDATRSASVIIDANGLQPIAVPITQRSFPFIFNDEGIEAVANNGGNANSNNTMFSSMHNLMRSGKEWTFSLNINDTSKLIALPILRAGSLPTLKFSYTRLATSITDSVTFAIANTVTAPTPILSTRDTSVTNGGKFMLLKVKTSSTPPDNPLATIMVTNGAQMLGLLRIQVRKFQGGTP